MLNVPHIYSNTRRDEMEVGIDVSKHKFDVVLINHMGKSKHEIFTNDPEGFVKFKQWLESLGALSAHVCMEATGRYDEEPALFLSTNNIKVSVVNPALIKAFSKSEGVRVKTDKVDAGVIARFCKSHSPETWISSPLETQ